MYSSFKSLEFAGDPEDVCHSLMKAVTENGLVTMPTHSYNFINRKDYGSYDKDISQSRTGIIPEIFRNMKNVHGSLHPTHSVAAWGKRSVDFIAGHELYEAVGKGTPYYKFSKMNGKILMIGCNLEVCTMIHEAEGEAKVPYRDIHYNPAGDYGGSYYNENKSC